MKNVILFSDFREDNRLSMDLYSDMLEKYLSNNADGFVINRYVPKIPSYFNNKQGLRLARYILYPIQTLGKKATIFHITDHGYGHLIYFLNPDKCVITVNDLIPILRWKHMIPGVKQDHMPILALISFYSLKRARHLIAISNSTKNDLVEILGINPRRISVIYDGVDTSFYSFDNNKKKEARDKWFGNNNGFKRILITGSQFYKNHETALKTIQLLQHNGINNIHLIKTGPITSEWMGLIKSYGLEKKVINIGTVPREDLPSLYNSVDLLLFPSVYEGLGLPPLEAMACGTPVVSSNAASLPEVVGDAGLMRDPNDYVGFADDIKVILSNDEYYSNLVRKGLYRVRKFDWNNTAKQVLQIYNDMLKYATE